jgi:hypothetical protein
MENALLCHSGEAAGLLLISDKSWNQNKTLMMGREFRPSSCLERSFCRLDQSSFPLK